ncbi:MAG: hypothetical protein ACLP29_09640 [Dissulfurispiraceae bacterium]
MLYFRVKHFLMLFLSVVLFLGSVGFMVRDALAGATVDIQAQVGPPMPPPPPGVGAPPPLEMQAPPDLIVIPIEQYPNQYVYMVPQMEGVYFYQGAWYRSYNGAWYGGPAYNGVWVPVQLQLVPPVIVGVWPEYALFLPLDYYRIHYGDYHSHWRDWEHDRHWNNYGWYKWLTWRPGVLRSGIKWLRNMGTIHGILPYIRA